MSTNSKIALFALLLAPIVAAAIWLCQLYLSVGQPPVSPQADPLRIVVMDPLCDRLACDCVPGYAQRNYASLGAYLEEQLARPVTLAYGENLRDVLRLNPGRVDLIVGKASVVSFDAADVNEPVRSIARLTDREGATDLRGLFVVRPEDPAREIADLKERAILLGPPYDEETHGAAVAALAAHGVRMPKPPETASSANSAALAVVEKEVDAAVISSYALPLLVGCGTIDEGALRVIGETAGVPFVTVFATAKVSPAAEQQIVDAFFSVKGDPELLRQMESKTGFVRPEAARPAAKETAVAPSVIEWTDWRGPNRAAISRCVPTELPTQPRFLWRRVLTGVGLSGIAATKDYVIVADKNEQKDQDIWRCLRADTGEELWTIAYAAAGEMEFTNAPRAAPVIHGNIVLLFSAFGDLHCVSLESRRILWRRNLIEDFDAELPGWGTCSTPLIVDEKVIVNPGGKDASVVALGLYAGELLWATPGEPAAYASFIVGTFGGVRQIVGYDAISLGGWDPNTGRRLWTLLPEIEGDFNVPTPINIDGRLLVTTENNGTRLYAFDATGQIRPAPVAENADLAPDTSTPVVIDDLVFGCFQGLYCLDAKNGLKTRYAVEDVEAFDDYAAFLAGNSHVLVVTVEGALILLKASPSQFTLVSRLELFKDTEVWSHPALLGNRLYIRSMNEIACLLLTEP